MYLGKGHTYYRGTEQAHSRAPFLILMCHDEPDGSVLGKRSKLRGIVRQVAMHQFGHFMMGRTRIGKAKLSLSGTYGSDGLPLTVDKDTWERGVPVPPELEEKYWKSDDGHNSAGSEGPDMYAWGQTLLKEKR